MKRVAIENASVDMLELFEKVSAESRREKKAVPPTNKMIYYWTRKPLIVGRGPWRSHVPWRIRKM